MLWETATRAALRALDTALGEQSFNDTSKLERRAWSMTAVPSLWGGVRQGTFGRIAKEPGENVRKVTETGKPGCHTGTISYFTQSAAPGTRIYRTWYPATCNVRTLPPKYKTLRF